MLTSGEPSPFFPTPDPPIGVCNSLIRGTPSQRPVGLSPLTIWEHSHPFGPPWRPPGHVQRGKISVTSGVVLLSLYFSGAQLLPLALSLECLGEKKSFHFTPSYKTPAVQPRDSSTSYLRATYSNVYISKTSWKVVSETLINWGPIIITKNWGSFKISEHFLGCPMMQP